MIDDDFVVLKNWVVRNIDKTDSSGQALFNFMNSLEIEASLDPALAVTLRRVVAAAIDDANRQQEAS